MNLIQLLEEQRTKILSRAMSALTHTHLGHYSAAGTEQGQDRLENAMINDGSLLTGGYENVSRKR